MHSHMTEAIEISQSTPTHKSSKSPSVKQSPPILVKNGGQSRKHRDDHTVHHDGVIAVRSRLSKGKKECRSPSVQQSTLFLVRNGRQSSEIYVSWLYVIAALQPAASRKGKNLFDDRLYAQRKRRGRQRKTDGCSCAAVGLGRRKCVVQQLKWWDVTDFQSWAHCSVIFALFCGTWTDDFVGIVETYHQVILARRWDLQTTFLTFVETHDCFTFVTHDRELKRN